MDQPVISPVKTKERTYRLEEDYSYEWEEGGKQCQMTAKKGFLFDGASIPSAIWGFPLMLSPAHPRILAAAVLHDLCYATDGKLEPNGFYSEKEAIGWRQVGRNFSKDEADELFRRINKSSGMDRTRRFLTYWAVRLFGNY